MALTRADRRAVSVARPRRHLSLLTPLRLSLTLALWPLVAQSQPLDSLIVDALSQHPATQSAQAQQASARAGLASARWQYWPTPSVLVETAGTSATDTAYQGDHRVATLRLQQPLWTGGRLSAGLIRADAGLVYSQASLDEVRQQLALRVVQAYGDWLAAQLKTASHGKSRVVHEELQARVKRRVEQGISAESDLVLTDVRLQSLAADLSVARLQQDTALARLGQLLGRPVLGAELSVAAPRAVDPAWLSQLDGVLAAQPAVQKAQAQARIQEAGVAERRAELSPEVYLRAERQYGNYAIRNAAPENRLFLGLSTRFGAGLSTLTNVEAAQAQQQAALADVQVQRRAATDQLLADHAQAGSSAPRLAALEASLNAAQAVCLSYDRQFLAGRKSWLDVMNAQRELAQTELALVDLQASQVVVTWRLALTTLGLEAVTGVRP